MDDTAKRYARRILLAHLLAFALLILFVIFAAREVYSRTRQEMIERTSARQTVLLNQTARGIESFYQSITNDLDLLSRTEGVATPTGAPTSQPDGSVSNLISRNLQDRASDVFVYDKATGSSKALTAPTPAIDAAVKLSKDWLAGVDAPAISMYLRIEGGGLNLVCVPSPDGRRVYAAIVPVAKLDQRYMQEVNRQSTMGLTLVDDSLATLATSNNAMVGRNLLTIPDPTLQAAVKQVISEGKPATLLFNQRVEFDEVKLEPAIVSAEPVRLPGRIWWAYIATSMSAVDSDIISVFRRAIIWAGVAIVALTGVLLSTAIVMIRERIRSERAQHNMLRRELDQAREIQLAWLPEPPGTAVVKPIDVAALNVPASHISGDFYNWFDLPDGRSVIVIGDVTGHGMSAAFLMATTQLLVRTSMPRLGDPGKCLQEVNQQLCVQVFNGQFVTMTLMVLDVAQGIIEIATAGHPAPLVSQGGAFTELPITPELVLGIEPSIDYPTERFPLPPKASILLYTDGVPDAQAPSGDRLGVEGMQQHLVGRYESAQALVDATVRIVDDFRGPMKLADDLTLVAIQVNGTPADARDTANA